ncbi:hypothetical protein DPMN_116857, partial [Dreissena polymorpha]
MLNLANISTSELTCKNSKPTGDDIFKQTEAIFKPSPYNIRRNVLTKFHEDWTINVTSRPYKNAPSHVGHVFRQTRAIFQLIQDIITINVMTKFHEDWTINVTSNSIGKNLLTNKCVLLSVNKVNAPPFDRTINVAFRVSNLWQNFIGTNVLTKFHEDWPINVANIDNCPPPPPGGHNKCSDEVFHKDWIINVTSRVLTRKNTTPPCGHFHEHWTTNVTSRVLTRKTAPPHGGHVFHSTGTIFELVQDIIGTHVLTKFHEDWTRNVTSRVLTKKTATPPGGHVFQPTRTIFQLVQDIIGTHVLTKFHEDWTKNVTSRVLTRKNATPPGGHIFQPTGTIFKLVQDIIGTHVLTKFHEDRTINVTSRVLPRFYYRKLPRPLAAIFFQSTGTIFELVQDIIGTHVLSKFHEDWTTNVASRVLT